MPSWLALARYTALSRARAAHESSYCGPHGSLQPAGARINSAPASAASRATSGNPRSQQMANAVPLAVGEHDAVGTDEVRAVTDACGACGARHPLGEAVRDVQPEAAGEGGEETDARAVLGVLGVTVDRRELRVPRSKELRQYDPPEIRVRELRLDDGPLSQEKVAPHVSRFRAEVQSRDGVGLLRRKRDCLRHLDARVASDARSELAV